MKLVLVNKPDLSTSITVTPTGANTYISIACPLTVKASATITVTSDDTMSVDNFSVCTKISISISGTIGEGTAQKDFTDSITINGDSVNSTINNQAMILIGANGTGAQGSTARIISCGQTSLSVD